MNEDQMTKEDIQALAVATAELVERKLAERDEHILREVHGARMAAERAANIGGELVTRIDRLETTQDKHEMRIGDHDRDLTRIGERLERLESLLPPVRSAGE